MSSSKESEPSSPTSPPEPTIKVPEPTVLPQATSESSTPDELPDPTHQTHPQQNKPSQSHIQNFISEAISATNPSLRHIGSISSFNSSRSQTSYRITSSQQPRNYSKLRPLSTTFEEQRYGGATTFSLTRQTKAYDPTGDEEKLRLGLGNETTISTSTPPSRAGKTVRGSSSLRFGSLSEVGKVGEGSDGKTLASQPGSGSLVDSYAGLNDKELEMGPGAGLAAAGDSHIYDTEGGGSTRALQENTGLAEDDEDENRYPGPLALFILITGIALSVFLISLDRTIITTAIPYITEEFQSFDDIGWYGSAYLLTASAFQPLYGRIFMLFNMKWSYLIALGLFELGSLICGVAPDSITLIIGRAIAGLGSAGILTGSFVVVSHAVPLAKRPILTAVVGLMFGVGATAGPLLGGVFTDLVTWRWCFYFNLPVGGATVASMVFFFHPPKSHMLMGKSFFYRIMELDIMGNVILLGASVMLFLALQLTEQRVSWGAAEVVGLLTGAGVAFILFCVWMWWKADGALMPPRILGQRTVAAACAAGFFIYAAILVHTYYLPIYFQAIRDRSAIGSGVDMIPYVVANAFFSLAAGIFVSKNGYFTAPAIVGMCIATVGCGLLSTLTTTTSTVKWVGYEILASAGFGMAIQQGFTAVQIVLPLDEVAIGTAAVVAFQSLGGAIFVSVGNTILQNALYAANIPGVDVTTAIDAGAASLTNGLTPEQAFALINAYNGALQKVFTAAIPMAGLAVFAAACMEWRNVKDQNRKDEEMQRKVRRKREDMERGLIDAAKREKRGSGMSEMGLTGTRRGSWRDSMRYSTGSQKA